MSPRLVISGGSGLLGINWAIQTRDDWDVHLLLHRREVSLPKVTCHVADLSTSDSAIQSISRLVPDLVINSVGMTNVDRCQVDKDLATHSNVVVAANMAAAAKNAGSKFVQISTDQLFNGAKPLQTEEDQPCPVNHYGSTKWKAEQVVSEILPDSLILRTNFFGWGPLYRHSFSDWILGALAKGQFIHLFEDVFYSPIYIPKLIEAAHGLVEVGQSGVFNIVGGERISKYQFGVHLCSVFGYEERLLIPSSLSGSDSLVSRPMDMSLSNNKLKCCDVAAVPCVRSMLEAMAADRDVVELLRRVER